MSERSPGFVDLLRFTHTEVMKRRDDPNTSVSDSGIRSEWISDTEASVAAGILTEGGATRYIHDDKGEMRELRVVGHLNIAMGGVVKHNILCETGEVWGGQSDMPKASLTEPMMRELIVAATATN